jgi:hypothetical protein
MIWIPYFRMSSRVKRTFTLQLEEAEEPKEIEEARFQKNNY